MANRFYDPGAARAARVRELFDTVASRYDLINDLQSLGLHRRWKRHVIELAAVEPGQRVLDVCCGTGDLARALARCGAAVVGVDFSAAMLRVAAARLSLPTVGPGATAAAPAIKPSRRDETSPLFSPTPHPSPLTPHLIRADALRLPFGDQAFDAVTVGYGLRNLADWRAGLAEMVRVAKPGARLVVLDFGKPANRLWRTLYFAYLRLVVPLFGWGFCGDAQAYAYILESLHHFPAQPGVAGQMRALGLEDVRVVNCLGGCMAILAARRPGGEIPCTAPARFG